MAAENISIVECEMYFDPNEELWFLLDLNRGKNGMVSKYGYESTEKASLEWTLGAVHWIDRYGDEDQEIRPLQAA